MDASNTEEPDAGRPFSSSPARTPPDCRTDPARTCRRSKSPKDRGDDRKPFDAG